MNHELISHFDGQEHASGGMRIDIIQPRSVDAATARLMVEMMRTAYSRGQSQTPFQL